MLLLGNASAAETGEDHRPVPQFAIWEFQVKGNSLLPNTRIELALSPYLGPGRNLDSVQDAAASLERAYKDAGYPTVLVNVPEQDVVGGLVLLEVMEGKVSRVRVSGSRYFLPSEIKQDVGSLQQGQPMHVPSFQADLNRVNSASGDLRVTPVLKPGRTPGTVEVDLRVKDELPLHGSLEVNNHNSLDTSDTRLAASVSYDNLWQKRHSLSVQVQNSPEEMDESRVLAGTYVFPAFTPSSRVALYAVNSESEVSTLSELTVLGDGNIYGGRLVQALDSSADYVHSLSLGMDYKDFDESVELVGADSDTTPIQYALLTGLYNGTIISESSTTRMGFAVTMGLREVLGGGEVDQFDTKRFQAQPNFMHLQTNIKYQYRFESDWRLNGRVKLQVADSPLISNEQLSVGGAQSVRGYYESQILGDDGVAASLETATPDALESKSELRGRWFVDAGWVRIKDALESQEDELSVSGTGLGLDWHLAPYLSATLDCAVALEESTQIEQGDLRVHAAIVVDF